MDSMFETLLDLASTSPDSTNGPLTDDGSHIRALACACLLSFTVALADTGKLLRAASAMLMSPKGAERILMPQILVSLQRSVVSVMLGKTDHPDLMSRGVPRSSCLDSFLVQFKTAPGVVHSLASDGPHVYLQTDQGVYKIGSGYGGTVKGRVYCHRPDFEPSPGWIGVVKGALYFKPGAEKGEAAARSPGDSQFEILRLDTDRLAVADSHVVKSGGHVTFSDGNHLGVVTVTNSDNFVVKWFALTPGSPTTTCVQVGWPT